MKFWPQRNFYSLTKKPSVHGFIKNVVSDSWLHPTPPGTVKMKLVRRQMKAALFSAKLGHGLP